MDSFGSKRLSAGYQKMTSSVPRLAAIKQSPLRPTRSDCFSNYVARGSPRHSLNLTPIPTETLRESPERVAVSPGSPIAKSTPFDTLKDNSPLIEKPEESSVAADLFEAGKDNDEELGCEPLDEEVDELNVTDLSIVQDRIQNKVTDIEAKDPYRLTYANEISSELSEEYNSHSPDSMAEMPCNRCPITR
jgi:hypothetical protein